MPSHDVFVAKQLTEGIEAARAKAERTVNKDGYDVLILQKMDSEEVVDARAKAKDIIDKIDPAYITGWADLKRKVDECSNDIRSYLEPKKDLP